MPVMIDLTDRELETLALDCLKYLKKAYADFIINETNKGVSLDEDETKIFLKRLKERTVDWLNN